LSTGPAEEETEDEATDALLDVAGVDPELLLVGVQATKGIAARTRTNAIFLFFMFF